MGIRWRNAFTHFPNPQPCFTSIIALFSTACFTDTLLLLLTSEREEYGWSKMSQRISGEKQDLRRDSSSFIYKGRKESIKHLVTPEKLGKRVTLSSCSRRRLNCITCFSCSWSIILLTWARVFQMRDQTWLKIAIACRTWLMNKRFAGLFLLKKKKKGGSQAVKGCRVICMPTHT